jgi:hypothetical protein
VLSASHEEEMPEKTGSARENQECLLTEIPLIRVAIPETIQIIITTNQNYKPTLN